MIEQPRSAAAYWVTNGQQRGAFKWWDDALDFAQQEAARTGRRHRVRWAYGRRWVVSVVTYPRPLSLVRAVGIDPRRRG